MNTTKKGKEFEDKAYRLFSELLASGDFIVGKNSKIFQHKKYYSASRKSDIDFDITVETYLPEKETPSFIVFIECKNYSHTVDISHVEEFNSKVSQISPRASKSVVITNSNFSEATLNYAKSQGIALVRLFDDDKIDWIVERTQATIETYIEIEKAIAETKIALTTFDYKIIDNFVVGFNEVPFYKISEFWNSLFSKKKFYSIVSNHDIMDKLFIPQTNIDCPFISDEKIMVESAKILSELDIYVLTRPCEVTNEKLIEYIKEKFKFDICFSEMPKTINTDKILALVDYENKKFMISTEIKSDIPRLKFTLAHELSHLILHYDILQNLISHGDNINFIAKRIEQRLEIQANKLASHIILPQITLDTVLKKIKKDYYLNFRGYYIYLDQQQCNQSQFFQITNEIMSYYNVSREVVKNRLVEIDFLEISSGRQSS